MNKAIAFKEIIVGGDVFLMLNVNILNKMQMNLIHISTT